MPEQTSNFTKQEQDVGITDEENTPVGLKMYFASSPIPASQDVSIRWQQMKDH